MAQKLSFLALIHSPVEAPFPVWSTSPSPELTYLPLHLFHRKNTFFLKKRFPPGVYIASVMHSEILSNISYFNQMLITVSTLFEKGKGREGERCSLTVRISRVFCSI